jgi:hypothetical protein
VEKKLYKIDERKNIYILLTDTGSLFTRTIKIYTKAQYNHVSIGFDTNLESLYSFGRKKPSNPIIGGFVKENIKTGTFARFKDTSFRLYSYSVNLETYYKMREIIREFEEQIERYRYNTLGLLGVLINKPMERKYAYFCSQFVASVLKRSGADIFEKPAALVTPDDFLRSGHLKLICAGKLAEYRFRDK